MDLLTIKNMTALPHGWMIHTPRVHTPRFNITEATVTWGERSAVAIATRLQLDYCDDWFLAVLDGHGQWHPLRAEDPLVGSLLSGPDEDAVSVEQAKAKIAASIVKMLGKATPKRREANA